MGLDTYTQGIKDFHKCWTGSLAKRRLCLGPTGVINCTSLSKKKKKKNQKTKIMASGAISSWQLEGRKVETVTDFIFLGSKITVDSECSHETKTLAPWKKSYYKPIQSIKKQRHHFTDKVSRVKAMIFPVVMCRCHS